MKNVLIPSPLYIPDVSKDDYLTLRVEDEYPQAQGKTDPKIGSSIFL
jgi:hypothetical protein